MNVLKSNIGTVLSALSVVTAVLLLSFPPMLLSDEEVKVAALSIVTICFWATGVIPEHITALLFFLFAMLFSVSTADVVFGGFQSTAVWLIFGGLIIGVAINTTGLGKRVANKAVEYLYGSYQRIIIGLVVAGVLFSFLMPSAMGRVVLLTPIGVAMADHFGFVQGSKGRTGVLLALILGSYFPAFAILPSNVPNMVMVGMAETQFQISPLYGMYLLLHFPVLGLLKAILIIGIIVWLFPDEPTKNLSQSKQTHLKMSRDERYLSVTLVFLLLLWMTDFVHHVSPAWITLAGAMFLLLPQIKIVGKEHFNQKVNWGSIIFVAGILGLGGVINRSGLGNVLAGKLLSLLPLGLQNDFVDFIAVSLAASFTGVATTLPGVPAVFTPLSDNISSATGLPVEAVLMMQVVGFSTTFLPYQAPPIIVGLQLSGEKFATASKVCFLLALMTILFLLPINFYWWKLMGWL